MELKWKLAQWVELRWWKFYLRDKNKEEYLEWKRDYWGEVMAKISEVLKTSEISTDKTICDLGCGPAGIFTALPENKIIAVDPLIDEYERQTLFFKRQDYLNVSFAGTTIEEFKSDRKFDLVFCMNAINHVRDIEMVFDKLKELCADEGAIILSVDAQNHSLFKYLFRLVPWDILHPHQYDLHEYNLFLENRRMKILKTELLKKEFFFNHYLIVAGK